MAEPATRPIGDWILQGFFFALGGGLLAGAWWVAKKIATSGPDEGDEDDPG